MKLVFAIALLAAPFAVSADRITYDRVYSNGSQSLATVACSDGDNGMLRRGFKTFEDLPTFPDIGGSSKIEGWNSFNCGSCYNVTYQDQWAIVTAIDHVDEGYNFSNVTVNKLTNGQAYRLGVIDGTVELIDNSYCYGKG